MVLAEGIGQKKESGVSTTDPVEDLDQETPAEPESPFYPAFGINAGVVEEIQDRYQVDPNSVDASWSGQFGAAPLSRPRSKSEEVVVTDRRAPSPARPDPISPAGEGSVVEIQMADRYARVLRLIDFFRARGHRIAKSDPLGEESTYFPELDPGHYGLGDEDMTRKFITGDLPGGAVQTLEEILERLRTIYCGSIGFEYSHVQDPIRKAWLRENFEEDQQKFMIDEEERVRIYTGLSRAENFERFLHTKFVGQKRFSLEGAESTVCMLSAVVEACPKLGIRELVLGMSHRGRLNVLANVMDKPYAAIFGEFQDNPLFQTPFGSGDVKYHKGYSSDRFATSGERIHLTLTSNPSHLEAVNPVALGRAKAKQTLRNDADGETTLPILLHAGSGIGKAVAHRMAEEGAHVVCADLSREAAVETAEELIALYGSGIGVAGTGLSNCGRALGMQVDITDRSSVETMFEDVVMAYGGIDNVIVTAGIFVPPDISGSIDDDKWGLTFEINVTGLYIVADEANRIWTAQDLPGSLVLTTSVNSVVSKRGSMAYDTSKAAANHLVRELAIELAPLVRVNGLAPATVVKGSSMFPRDRVIASLSKYEIEFDEDEVTETLRNRLAQFYADRTLTKVPITPEDNAEAAYLLASERLGRTTGQILSVDGGLHEGFLR